MKKIFMGMMVLAAFMLVGTQMAEAKGNRGNRAQVSENTETTDSAVVGKKHPNARQNRGEETTSSKRLEGNQRRLEGKEKAIQRRLEGKEKAMQGHNGEGKKMGHRKHKRANIAEDETTDNQTKQRKNRRMNKQSD